MLLNKELIDWKDRLNQRNDLKPLFQNKNICVEFTNGEESTLLELLESKMNIYNHSKEDIIPDVVIHAPIEILKNIWNGTVRLLHIPDEKIDISGRYRDLLLVESIFHLSKINP